ncbi:MAG TPA: hypothetical protein VJI98_01040 [Candidatus Nanoarchaeia archaeon]|nr:hypothetical protein [Candidatus Nanoarchaeia archaeon]
MNEQQKIICLQEKILEQHPSWPQEKARWIALQCLGITGYGARK